MFIAVLFTITKIWEQPKCPSIDETAIGHLHSGILLGHKKEENFTLCNSRDGPGEGYAKERNQQRNAILFHSCGI